jgi:autoinducer 2 (AI-2) kinase
MARRCSTLSTPITSSRVPADAVLVIDAGTSGMRGVLVCGPEATTIASEPWRIVTPHDGSPFTRELDPREVREALGRLVAAAADQRDRITGIAFTGQREGLVFVDADGEALCVSPNVDGRAAMEGMAFDARFGERVYAVTGHLPSLLQAPAKFTWLRANRPSDADRVRRVLPLADWLAAVLTGEQAMSRSLAAEVGLLDISSGEVPAALLETLDLDPSLVPLVVADGTVAGHTRSDPAGLPVALCGADTQCALAGMGIVRPGDAAVPAGWSAPVQMVAAAPIMDAHSRIWTSLHVMSRRWVLESNAGDCGRAWRWLCETLSLDDASADARASASPAGAHDVVAVLGPPRMRAAAMNVMTGGLMLPTPLAVSAPNSGDLLRATLEGAAYAVRANLEQLEDIAGAAASSVAVGGGMSRSALFPQILADVISRPVHVARSPETSALGAAAIASPAFGLHATIDEALDAASREITRREPDMRTSATYDDCYQRWLAIATTLEGAGL